MSVFVSSMIYPRHCIDEASADYSDFCTVVISNESSMGCRLDIEVQEAYRKSTEGAEGRIIQEYLNYLLDLSLHYHLFGRSEAKNSVACEGDQFSV
jgi:hypothetical protein